MRFRKQKKKMYDYELWDVEVMCVIRTTVRVRAKNPLSAAKTVDDTGYPLPPARSWETTAGGWEYTVREPGGKEIFYQGKAQELS